MGLQGMVRPTDKHIDSRELASLVPWSEGGREQLELSPEVLHTAERHVESCATCQKKVSEYRQLVKRLSRGAVSEATPPGVDCPNAGEIPWHEVAAGRWPESRTSQLILHASLCPHCGPLLRAATSIDDDATPQEEELLAQLKTPFQPAAKARPERKPPWRSVEPVWRWFFDWKVLVPAATLMLLAGVLSTRQPGARQPLPGPAFAEFAVQTHRQHAQGSFSLDVREESQQALNEWFKTKSPFAVALPGTAPPNEDLPYRLVGARLVQYGGKTAVFIAYQMERRPVSLLVTPESVAAPSGGVEVHYKRVTFHYRMVEGYKVVTWSVHGLTYALVSQEGNHTQRSCMVCHSAMHDMDLNETSAPLPEGPISQ